MTTPTSIIHCLDASIQEKGGRVELDTPAGPLTMTLPPGLSDGQTLRLAGRGELGPDGERGDVLLTIRFFSSSDAPHTTAEPTQSLLSVTGLPLEAVTSSSAGGSGQKRASKKIRSKAGKRDASRPGTPENVPATSCRPQSYAEKEAGRKEADKSILLFFGCTTGLACLGCALLPHGFPFYPVFSVVCTILLMILGIAVARLLAPSQGTAQVLRWRSRVRYTAFVVWFSGILASYFVMGQEGSWLKQHGPYWSNWISEALHAALGEPWPVVSDNVNHARAMIELAFAFIGMPVVIVWLSGFWPGYRDQQENEATR